MIQRPLLIAVEGCDGTGKTTLVAALVQAFLSLGILAASIKRPAKDALAAFYVQGQTATDAQVLTKMNADCRAAIDTARAMQANGTPIVILDRHYISAAIYQGGANWQGEFERQCERWGEPDLWVFCDSDWQTVTRRIRKRDEDHDKYTPIETIAARLAQYEWIAMNVQSPRITYTSWDSGLGKHAAITGVALGICEAIDENALSLNAAEMIAQVARRL